MDPIPYPEVTFHPHSFGDPDGRLFWWNGQLYRGLRSESAILFQRLLQDGIVQRLVERGLLIDTEPTPLHLDGYAAVVQHRYVPFASYPEEWCPAMLKDAALALLDLLIELVQEGLTLKDAHPWNVLFDGCKPVYVDLTSIIPMKDHVPWPGYDEFCRFCLYPLILMAHGQDRIARRLLPEYDGIQESELFILTHGSTLADSIPRMLRKATAALRRTAANPLHRLIKKGGRPMAWLWPKEPECSQAPVEFLKNIRATVEGVKLPSFAKDRSAYDAGSYESLSRHDTQTAEHRCLHDVLMQLRPTSVLDIGSNAGWYSKLAKRSGSTVVTFNKDVQSITQIYSLARDNGLPILPLIMDFADPTPSRGLASHWAIAATERFRCDMVLALQLINDLVFSRNLNFDHIVEGLALFSNRWLLVEFVPPEDREVCQWRSSLLSWYTLDNFICRLKRQFDTVSALPSYPKPRVLLLCEK